MNNTLERLMEKGNPIPEKYRRRGKYTPNEDPSDYFVPAPEKGGVKMGGYAIEREMEVRMREVLDKGQYHFRTFADISRSALYHFMYSIVMQGEGFSEQYRALARTRRREVLALNAAQDDEMFNRCLRHYRMAADTGRDGMVFDIMEDLRLYMGSFSDEHRELTMKARIDGSEMGAAYKKRVADYYKNLELEKAREEGIVVPQLPEGGDEALNALVEEGE